MEGPRLRGCNLNWVRPPNEVYLPNTRYPYRQGAFNENVRRGNVFMDFPRWKDNPRLINDPEDGDDDNTMPNPVKWLDNEKTCAVISGQMDLRGPITGLLDDLLWRSNIGVVRQASRDMLNAYNPAVHHGLRYLLGYLASMTSQLREILSVNATFRNHFPMPIKQMYHGALHQEAKIMRHYAQMTNPTTAIYVENHQRGIAAIQRHNFLKEHNAFERMLRKEIGGGGVSSGISLIDLFKCRTVNYIIIQCLLYSLGLEMKKMNDACYAMPNHPSCQIIQRKETLNTERLILHIAYINYEDVDYFRKCYARIYRCKCFL